MIRSGRYGVIGRDTGTGKIHAAIVEGNRRDRVVRRAAEERGVDQLRTGNSGVYLQGRYEVQVLDSELRSKATASGEAAIENQSTTLKTTLDLRLLPPGTYRFAVRRQGDEWQMFPATLK